MDIHDAMRELERLGTEQDRKVYRRHGAGDVLFGVSFASLSVLTKQIKTDQALAEALWATANADARMLATMIADPAQIKEAQVEAWLRDLRYHVLVDLLVSHVVSKTPFAPKLMERWIASDDEWVGRAGWTLVVTLASAGGPELDALLERYLVMIERSIHAAKNRTREAMNSALIQIGGRNEVLRRKALVAAKRIGNVEVDHGDTGCKTPEAVGYIEKMWAHRGHMEVKHRAKAAADGAKKAAAKGARKAAANTAKKASPAPKKTTTAPRKRAAR